MRTAAWFVLFYAAALSILTVGPACIGAKVKPHALFPPAALTWPAVEEDFDRGIAAGLITGDLTSPAAEALHAEGDTLEAALQQRDLASLRTVPWENELRPWAARGIDAKLADGDIGQGVAEELRGQLDEFTDLVLQLQGIF